MVNENTHSVEGCHETRDDAEAQLAALYANEPDAEEAAVTVFDEITRLVFQDEECPPGQHKMATGECMPDEEMGGKPNQGTKPDKRLKRNKQKASTGAHLTFTAPPPLPPQTPELAALTAALSEDHTSIEEELDSVPASTVPWKGPMTIEGERTGDGRQFAVDSLTWPDPVEVNMALQWQKETSHGGFNDVTVNVGRITEVWREGEAVWGRGYVDTASEDGEEIARRMKLHEKLGVSIVADDPENEEIEFVYPEGCDDGGIPFDLDQLLEADPKCFFPETTIFHSGRIRALTVVDVPAFVNAWISLDEDASSPEVKQLVAAAHLIVIPDVPPAEWFTEPTDRPAIGALTVTDEGRVYGYLAPRGVAHRAFPDKRIEVPMRNVDYDTWATRPTIVQGGERIATGPITMDCGHADPLPWITGPIAREHYDNSCSVVATVAIGENAHGVWIAGALLHDVTPSQVARMLACQLSGDWRAHRERPGMREFCAALLVPGPGFPMANPRFSMRLDHGQLVASMVPVRREHDHGSSGTSVPFPTWEEIQARLAAKTASASVEEVEEARSLARELERGTLVPTT